MNGQPPPAVGLHRDVPFADYRRWQAINASTLVAGYRGSPRHMLAAWEGRSDDETRSLKFGLAVHLRLLEPDRFESIYRMPGRCIEPLASGKRKGQACGNWAKYEVDGVWVCGTHAPRGSVEADNILTLDEAAQIEAIRESVMGHEVVGMLRAHGGMELSASWELDGTPAKSRFDKLIYDAPVPSAVVDIKKVQRYGGTRAAWPKSVQRYSYDIQAAFYVAAAEQLIGERVNLIWVCVEEVEPYDVTVIQCDQETLVIGRERYKQQFARFRECEDTGRWPGCSYNLTKERNEIFVAGLPDYIIRRELGR